MKTTTSLPAWPQRARAGARMHAGLPSGAGGRIVGERELGLRSVAGRQGDASWRRVRGDIE
jgi:hypothetical protein